MDDDTTLIPVFSSYAPPYDDVTEQTTTATFEGPSPFGLRPLPPPLEGERAYLVEVHAPRRPPGLLAIRRTLQEASGVANDVHPGVADVTIRELQLPCDATSLMRALAELRTWTRDAAGVWSPPLPSHDDDADRTLDGSGETTTLGAFARGS